MSVRRGFLNWGVFLIALGAVPLAVQLGWIDRAAAAELLRLWPLILIGIGLGLLLRLTPYGAIGGIVVAGTLGILIGTALAGGFPSGAVACSGAPADAVSDTRNGTFGGSTASLNIELTCGDIEVARAPGGAWSVDVVTGPEDVPAISSTDSSLTIRSDTAGGFVAFGGDSRESWHVTLPSEPALAANITFNAATTRLALGNGALNSISATYNASDGRLDLSGGGAASANPPDVRLDGTLNASSLKLVLPDGQLSGAMTLNAASLEICFAPTAGLRIVYEETLGSNNFAAAGLVAVGKLWSTPGYDSAASQSELRLQSNVSSITLNPSGGCQ